MGETHSQHLTRQENNSAQYYRQHTASPYHDIVESPYHETNKVLSVPTMKLYYMPGRKGNKTNGHINLKNKRLPIINTLKKSKKNKGHIKMKNIYRRSRLRYTTTLWGAPFAIGGVVHAAAMVSADFVSTPGAPGTVGGARGTPPRDCRFSSWSALPSPPSSSPSSSAVMDSPDVGGG